MRAVWAIHKGQPQASHQCSSGRAGARAELHGALRWEQGDIQRGCMFCVTDLPVFFNSPLLKILPVVLFRSFCSVSFCAA